MGPRPPSGVPHLAQATQASRDLASLAHLAQGLDFRDLCHHLVHHRVPQHDLAQLLDLAHFWDLVQVRDLAQLGDKAQQHQGHLHQQQQRQRHGKLVVVVRRAETRPRHRCPLVTLVS